MAIAVPVVAAAALWALPLGRAGQAQRIQLPVLGPTSIVPGKHASVVRPAGWQRIPSRPEGAVLRFHCYTAAMFAYLQWADEGTGIVIDPALRRAEAHRNGVALALTYDVHEGCATSDHAKATRDVRKLLESFE